MNKIKQLVITSVVAFLVVIGIGGSTSVVHASKGDLGVDNSFYQGTLGNLGSASTKFNIVQIGGIYNSSIKYQSTYDTQVQYTIAQGRRAHTYIFLADGSDQARTKTYVSQMLSKVQTPKNSIVAIDYESGATSDKEANTANIMLAMQLIKNAGYTPMVYSYKPYFESYINASEIANEFGSDKVWIASYKTTSRQTAPDYNYFPTFDNVAIWQYGDNTGTNSSGVDGDVDLTGITDNGYSGTTTSSQGGTQVKTDSTTSAIKAGQTANNTSKSDIKAGDVIKVNFSATKWSTGVAIPSWVKGNSYTVAQVSGDKLLLSGIDSWINKSDAEILSVTTTKSTSSTKIVVDGIPGYNTYPGLQKLYGMRVQDGKISKPSPFVKVLQKHLGVTQDGYFGPVTYRAMQKKLGTPIDGKVSRPSLMWKQIQRDINNGVKPF